MALMQGLVYAECQNCVVILSIVDSIFACKHCLSVGSFQCPALWVGSCTRQHIFAKSEKHVIGQTL
jgi:hypothetical protein